MTKKNEVDLEKYIKPHRLLSEKMEKELMPDGGLFPVLNAVTRDMRLRVDIREKRINVYYRGGNLLCVDGRESTWKMSFDEKYFKGGSLTPPKLPAQYSGINDSRQWVNEFPNLISGMDDWWLRNSQAERDHCQQMAIVNNEQRMSSIDYLVLDLEYQWAQRRFDMIAIKRKPTSTDQNGWSEPDFVFIEVKSACGACSGKSGLADHARDYHDIILAQNGKSLEDIKEEHYDVICQKKRLKIYSEDFPFKRFSKEKPELLIVLIDIDPNNQSLATPMADVKVISNKIYSGNSVKFMRLESPKYEMTKNKLF